MGKASKFFKALLGFKTSDLPPSRSQPNKQLNRRWSFVKPRRGNSGTQRIRGTSNSLDGNSFNRERNRDENDDPNKHAAATAAVVDAAVAAAQAAADVVRITSRTTAGYGVRHELAAIKIQSCFRAYLARRALRALKALVRLQAVVRGHILRKQTADMMRRLQALIRAQARARAMRSQISDSITKPSSHFHHHGPPTPEKSEHFPHTKNDHRSISKSSCISGYLDHPNYMANTESSRAKVRSLSAPRLRTQLETSNATKKDPGYKYGSGMQRVATRDSFAKKGYRGSGRLDQRGMPIYDAEESEFCLGYWN